MRLGIRGANIAATLKTKTFTFLGVTLEVIRSDSPEWLAWTNLNTRANPIIRDFSKEQLVLQVQQSRGGRHKTAMDPEELTRAAADRAFAVNGQSASQTRAMNLAEIKPGLAAVAVRYMSAPSSHVTCSACGHRWELEEAGDPCPSCGDAAWLETPETLEASAYDRPGLKADPDKLRKMVEELLANPVDRAGNPVYLYGHKVAGFEVDEPLGDAFAGEILAEMDDLKSFAAEVKDEAVRRLAHGVAGRTESGSSSLPSSGTGSAPTPPATPFSAPEDRSASPSPKFAPSESSAVSVGSATAT